MQMIMFSVQLQAVKVNGRGSCDFDKYYNWSVVRARENHCNCILITGGIDLSRTIVLYRRKLRREFFGLKNFAYRVS